MTAAEFAQRLLFMKAFKTFWSIVVLSERRLTDDAAILLRSLLNLWVVARWIRRDPLRAQRYREWYWIAARRVVEQDPERLKEHPELLAGIAEAEDAFRAQGWNVTGQWHGSDIKQMATEVDLSNHYEVVYRSLSSIEHSDVMAYVAMIRASGPGLQISLWNDASLEGHLGLAFAYFIKLFEEWNTEILAVEPERIHALGLRSVELLRPEHRPAASRNATNEPGSGGFE